MAVFVIILIIVVIVGVLIALRSIGTKRVSVRANADLATTRQAVEHAFNKAVWNRTNGPGDLNFVARGRQNPPTLSVSLAAAGANATDVDLWPSSYNKLWGFAMQHATLCWRKNHAVARKLARL